MKAIFLDRDGVVIRKAPEGKYISNWGEVDILPGSLQAIAELCRCGYKVFFVTNQRGIALGKISLPNLNDIHSKLEDTIRCAGGILSGIYFCPHDYSDQCACRKPKPGMLISAAIDHQLVLSDSWMVGDAPSDIAAGKIAGCKTALISPSREVDLENNPDVRAASLILAAREIIALQLRELSARRNDRSRRT